MSLYSNCQLILKNDCFAFPSQELVTNLKMHCWKKRSGKYYLHWLYSARLKCISHLRTEKKRDTSFIFMHIYSATPHLFSDTKKIEPLFQVWEEKHRYGFILLLCCTWLLKGKLNQAEKRAVSSCRNVVFVLSLLSTTQFWINFLDALITYCIHLMTTRFSLSALPSSDVINDAGSLLTYAALESRMIKHEV